MSSLLLDTCAVLWIANRDEIDAGARAAIARGALHVSPISAWEIANLVRKNRIALTMPIAAWFQQTMERMQAALLPLSVDILVESCLLPGRPAGDPADRIIIATARERGLVIVTRDKAILGYAQDGHVRAMRC
jgi:PIN domain nuclease of toxin-antitoxin system